MHKGILHIYKNTPLGREFLFQSIFFSKKINTPLYIYIPKYKNFNMYFEDRVVSVSLESSYFRNLDNALDRVKRILKQYRARANFIEPKEFTASTLPDLPVDFSFMTSPRIISEPHTKALFGNIGRTVRNILLSSQFPIILPSYAFKKWDKIFIMFGGSRNAVKAFRVGCYLAKRTKDSVYLFTQQEDDKPRSFYESIILERGLKNEFSMIEDWMFFEKGEFIENLFEIPSEALVVLGLFGHGIIKDIMFGSKMEMVQKELPNNLLVVGPHFKGFFV